MSNDDSRIRTDRPMIAVERGADAGSLGSKVENPHFWQYRPELGHPKAGYEGLHFGATVLLDNVRSMYNVGAFFRAADGVGLQKLWLCGITAHPPKKAISKTALGAEETVAWEHGWDGVQVAEGLRRGGFEIAAIETGAEAVELFEWEPRFPVCVAFGHEVDGLRPELLELADTHVRIPMLGRKKSLNVATAGGVVLYELLRKWRGGVSEAGKLQGKSSSLLREE